MRYIDDAELPADSNWVENQIRPISRGARTAPWSSPKGALQTRGSLQRNSTLHQQTRIKQPILKLIL